MEHAWDRFPGRVQTIFRHIYILLNLKPKSMKVSEIKERRLQEGQKLFFDNTAHQESIEDDDIRGAEIWHDSQLPGWANGYKIYFNGGLIHSSKTFKSMINRLNKLIERWNLEHVSTEEN